MSSKKRVQKSRVFVKAAESLSREQLSNCRLVKVYGSNRLMLAPAHVLTIPANCRYIHQVTEVYGKPVYSSGKIKPSFHGLSLYDPTDWLTHFKNIDSILNKRKKSVAVSV